MNIQLKVGNSYEVENPSQVKALNKPTIIKIIKQEGEYFIGDDGKEYLADGSGVISWHPRYYLAREVN